MIWKNVMNRKVSGQKSATQPRSLLAVTTLICLAQAFYVQSSAVAADILRPGDRVVFVGDGLIEQEQYSGWVEALLTASHPGTDVSFRNIGWSGDTPAGDSRLGLSLVQAGREPDGEGWRQLQAQLELTQPTVLVVGYGMASGLEAAYKFTNPQQAADAFTVDFERLVASAKRISPEVRFAFITPIDHLDPNNATAKYIVGLGEAIKQLAGKHDAALIDLAGVATDAGLRKDPVHLNDAGYKAVALEVAKQLSLNGRLLANPRIEALRQQILRKNEWWFHRSRPANMAYVFGFRKHEQGQNAVEIPQFDSLIAEEEQRIAKLRKLEPTAVSTPGPRLESKYAEFTPQPVPEFTVAPGWEVTLWAQNPLLNKPIHMNFDPQGRLWVASSEAYPMIEVGQAAPDKVVVLQDTNGDGTADSSTVFADGLLIPTGIAPGNGGVYVAQSTDLLFLKDTDGDGKADVRQRVLSGFGTEDTHHNLHTLRWGPDGRLYMNQSVYTRTDAETPHGVARLRGGGGFRVDTKRLDMEVFFRGMWNSWGHQFDQYGQSFLSDGAGFAGLGYCFPGAKFNPTPGARQQLDLISPGNWPKFASLEIIGGEAYPDDWQGSIITCDFRANRVTRFSLADDGAGFVTKQEADLVRTSAATFRPIDVKQGPDGALYIADWSNPIINHGEVDFRDSRRDRWHGRIWRVKWTGGKAPASSPVAGASTLQLLDNLLSEDGSVREQSRRVLLENPKQTQQALVAWTDQNDSPLARLQSLWIHEGLDLPNKPLLAELLASDDARVRAASVRVLAHWSDPNTALGTLVEANEALGLLAQCIGDQHPRVRLEAVRGLARLGTAEAGLISLAAIDLPVDRFVDHALTLTVNELADPLMQVVESGRWPTAAEDAAESEQLGKQLEFLIARVPPQQASQYLSRKLASESIPADGSGPWIELIAKAGGPAELNQLLQYALDSGTETAAAVRALRGLADAQRLRRSKPSAGRQSVATLANGAGDNTLRGEAVKLLGLWKMGGQAVTLGGIASDAKTQVTVRHAAIGALRALGGQTAASELARIAAVPAESTLEKQIQTQAVVSLASIDANRAAKPLLAILAASESEEESLGLWRSALSANGVGKALAPLLVGADLPEYVIVSGTRAMNDSGRNDAELSAMLATLGGKAATREWTPELQAKYVEMLTDADPAQGELIYRRPELACATCHAIGGIGGRVGPDMTSLGASAPADYIVESIFAPNAKIKEGFHSVSVATEDGRVFTGIEVKSDDQEILLRDSTNKEIRIPQVEVIGKKAATSLMPTGVVDRLSMPEQADLIRFLTELGKPGPFDASGGGVARSLEIFAGTHRIEQAGADKITSGNLPGWKPAQAFVDGTLPRNVLQELTRQPINIALVHVYARAKVQQAELDRVSFKVNSPIAAFWIDGKEVDASNTDAGARQFTSQLAPGEHTVIVRLDARELPQRFRLEADKTAFVSIALGSKPDDQ